MKSDDIEEVANLVLNYSGWNAKISKDIKRGKEERPTEFDYQSVHIILTPTEDDSRFASDVKPAISCELQIRTLLQHAFAEVSHDSTYKGPYKNDKDILRKLAKSMALMEATDDYFCEIFTIMTDETRIYNSYINGLITLFKRFESTFERSELDIDLTDEFFSLLELKNVDLPQIEIFVNKNENELRSQINENFGFLFTQPIILLILFYFENDYSFITGGAWPLNQTALQTIYSATGTSPH